MINSLLFMTSLTFNLQYLKANESITALSLTLYVIIRYVFHLVHVLVAGAQMAIAEENLWPLALSDNLIDNKM